MLQTKTEQVFKVTARKVIAVGGKGSNGEGWPPSSGAAIQVKDLWKN